MAALLESVGTNKAFFHEIKKLQIPVMLAQNELLAEDSYFINVILRIKVGQVLKWLEGRLLELIDVESFPNAEVQEVPC